MAAGVLVTRGGSVIVVTASKFVAAFVQHLA
jgi:hypothetical protein